MGTVNKTIPIKPANRECGTCTKCCEGWVTGQIHGIDMMPGQPCHFVKLNEKCSIYEQRPQSPCKDFVCEWIKDPAIPEWLKPNISNVILKESVINDIHFLNMIECGVKVDSSVLNWVFKSLITGKYQNIYFKVDGGVHYYGTPEFNNAMSEVNNYAKRIDF